MATSSPPSQPPQSLGQHWCHHCDKRVSVEPSPDNQPDVICSDCKFGFVESIPPPPPPPPPPVNRRLRVVDDDDDDDADGGGVTDDNTLGSQFVHVLRLLAQVARDDNPSPPSPPPPPPRGGNFSLSDDPDFLRIEIDNEEDGENNDENDDDEADEEESVRSVEIEGDDVGDSDEDDNNNETEDDIRRRRREMLHLRLRDFSTRARSGRRNRILEWAEILMGLENNSIEFRFEEDRYIGNPGDYVNEAEYEALLQNLADSDGRRGAPPASKTAVDALKAVEVKDEEMCFVCAICKDGVSIGEVVKEMPCGHCYHGDCIVPWLAARNSCPVCRFELPTDDPEYEEDKRKKVSSVGGDGNGVGGGGGGGSSSLPSVDDDDEDGLF